MVDTMTVTQLKSVYSQFQKYATRTLNSTLQNLKQQSARELNTRAMCGSKTVAEDVPLAEATYILAKDSNYIPGLDEAEDLSDAVSMLSINDDKFSYDSHVSAFKSVAGKGRKLISSAISATVMLPTRSNKKM
eukprot:15364637-Ditylum_brightwellii.AAC.2